MPKINLIATAKKRLTGYLNRRPHRSFRRTRRRDYARPLDLPGYFAFTGHVNKTLWSNRKVFLSLALAYAVITVLVVGIASQDSYATLSDLLKNTSGDMFNGFWGGIGGAGLMVLTAISGGLSQSLSESQQIYAGLITLMVWLTTVWLLRNILAGHKVKMRDGLYNAGAPILPTFLVSLLLIIQLLPIALALIGYSAASTTGLLGGGVEAMLFWAAAALLTTLSLYWISSTFFALIIITLPGMYPFNAIKTAGDLMVGRRFKVLLRLLWMAVVTLFALAITLIPIVMLDSWIKGLWPAAAWAPIVPVALLAATSLTLIWISSYIYLLYRKVVASESK